MTQSLALTLQIDAGTIAVFDDCRKLRNASDYERAGGISDTEADAMLNLALRLAKKSSMDSCEPSQPYMSGPVILGPPKLLEESK